MARADYVSEDSFDILLKALMPENRLALEVSLATGLRIDDVLHLKTAMLEKERFTIKEMKTGKTHRVRIPKDLREQCLRIAGRYYVFEHRTDPKKTRHRNTVYKDLKRACAIFRVKGLQISPHTARKIYAVGLFDKSLSIDKVREKMNHKYNSTTEIYALSDMRTEKATRRKKTNIPK